MVDTILEFVDPKLLLEADRREGMDLDFGGHSRIRVRGGVDVLFRTVHEFIEFVGLRVTKPAPEVLSVVDPFVEEMSVGRICLSHTVPSLGSVRGAGKEEPHP